MAKLAAHTMSSMMFIGLASWPRATTQTLGGGSVGSSFGPYSASRRLDSAPSSPRAGSTPSCPATSSGGTEYHGSFPAGCLTAVISAPLR